jgi:hypothetical protein
MVTKLLRCCGLDLGAEADLMEPRQDNPNGYWENVRFVEINEALLNALGGGWDCPPPWPDDWSGVPGVYELLARANALVGEFDSAYWGWKDPRNSLTLPFWRMVVPAPQVVIPIRHPLEVALSLRRRNGFSAAHSVGLWQTHYERVLSVTEPEERLCVSYGAVLEEPVQQLARLADFTGLRPDQMILERAAGGALSALRHHVAQDADVAATWAPAPVVDLYRRLCEEAGESTSASLSERNAQIPSADDQKLPAWAALALSSLESTLRQQAAALDRVWAEVVAQATIVRSFAADGILAPPGVHESHVQSPGEINPPSGRGSTTDDVSCEALDYPALVSRVRQAVEDHLPPGAVVAVTSRGDDALLQFDGRQGWHFPQTLHGVYAGHNPADGVSAVSHLEQLWARGAEYVVFPSTTQWWLNYYGELREYLTGTGRVVAQDESCVIFALPARSDGPAHSHLDSPDGYPGLAEQMCALVEAVLPAGSTAAVISRGDGELTRVNGLTCVHFPRSENGDYAGCYPQDSEAAVTHLEDQRRLGVRYLVIPQTAFWWLRHYDGLRRHLDEQYRQVVLQRNVCMVFDLNAKESRLVSASPRKQRTTRRRYGTK